MNVCFQSGNKLLLNFCQHWLRIRVLHLEFSGLREVVMGAQCGLLIFELLGGKYHLYSAFLHLVVLILSL